MTTTGPGLPGDDQVGEVRDWRLPALTVQVVDDWERVDVPGGVLDLRARLLGFGESRSPNRPRWLEVRLFLDEAAGEYVIHTAGCSRIEGEVPLCRVERVTSADAVIERLLRRRQGEETYMPMPSRRAIEQATLEDEDLRDAWADARAAYLRAS